VTRFAIELVLRHGFEPCISLTLITERAIACIISISYDREEAGQDERAMACYQDLLRQLAQRGYHSYRLSIASLDAAETSDNYTGLLRSVKRTLDPEGILAPGRYVGTSPSRPAISSPDANSPEPRK
jgi:4-cresol dehydrogenase (hydroxylating)